MKAAVLEKITSVRENPQPLSFVELPDARTRRRDKF